MSDPIVAHDIFGDPVTASEQASNQLQELRSRLGDISGNIDMLSGPTSIEQDHIAALIQEKATEIHNHREEWLMTFFGSYEAAEKYGKLFVLETNAVKVLPEDNSFVEPHVLYPSDTNVYRIEETNTIRPKTYLELHDEGLIPLCIEAENDPLFHQIGKKTA